MQHTPVYDWNTRRSIKYFSQKLIGSQLIQKIGNLGVGGTLIEYHFT